MNKKKKTHPKQLTSVIITQSIKIWSFSSNSDFEACCHNQSSVNYETRQKKNVKNEEQEI
jgi:hypothetical protein